MAVETDAAEAIEEPDHWHSSRHETVCGADVSASICIRSCADGAVEMGDVAERPRLHHAAFHDAQRKLGERPEIGAGAESGRAAAVEAAPRPRRPRRENWRRATRAPAGRAHAARAPGCRSGSRMCSRSRQRAAVGREQREHALDRIADARPSGFEQHRANAVAIGFENRDRARPACRERNNRGCRC